MIPFLKAVAKAYITRYSDLSEFCFLFPNKRSGTFFLKYLKEEAGNRVFVSPEIVTITDFVSDLSGRVVAGRLDLLFLLFECYRQLSGEGKGIEDGADATDFDSFRGWGETVLSDFSEVDQYLVNHEEIFRNVKDYRELASNFLTEEQKGVLAEYFGRVEVGDSSKFWKNFDSEDEDLSNVKRRFIHLWRVMGPLYSMLNEKLAKKNLTTTGGSYRLAVENLREKGRDVLAYKKIIAVGFNALSTSENTLFKELRDMDPHEGYENFADFFWDMTGPVLKEGVNSASKFVKANIKMFPAPSWALAALEESEASTLPHIKVVASPSNSAQTKIAGNLLSDLRGRITAGEINSAKVAVILPDENLLLPMLYSLPDGMGEVNLTMGYPLRLTSVVPFVTLLRRLHFNVRIEKGDYRIYHRDLRQLFAHPFSHLLFGSIEIQKTLDILNIEHRSTISISELNSISHTMKEVLDPSRLGEKAPEVVAYISFVLNKVKDKLPKEESLGIKSRLDEDHIDIYLRALQRLSDLLDEYSINMRPSTVFRLVDRILAGETVGFKGEPLTGLQVMGSLETRSIDFEHLFVLSMNEKIMPMRARKKTFIPDSLRHAYGMPPSNYAENIFAYYFYRMISRAKEVTLLYDARNSGGISSGDVSRYIVQLRELFAKGEIEEEEWKFTLSGKPESEADIAKTAEVKKLLILYEDEKSKKNFSASSLNDYRECQARFFYRDVMGINTDPAPSEFIDAIGVGNILHELMEALYLPPALRGKYLSNPVVMTEEKLVNLLEDRDIFKTLTTRIVNKRHFYRGEEELDTPLTGAAALIGDRIAEMARKVVRHDFEIAPFKIYGSEIKERLRIELPSGRIVNFKFAIDRLDEVTVDGIERLRIVDYKTGGIKLEAKDFSSMMAGETESKQIFQLFTYAWLLGKAGIPSGEDVITEIYDVPGILKEGRRLPKISKKVVNGFSEYSEEFSAGIEKMLEDVFTEREFKATTDERHCEYCAFRSLCRR